MRAGLLPVLPLPNPWGLEQHLAHAAPRCQIKTENENLMEPSHLRRAEAANQMPTCVPQACSACLLNLNKLQTWKNLQVYWTSGFSLNPKWANCHIPSEPELSLARCPSPEIFPLRRAGTLHPARGAHTHLK